MREAAEKFMLENNAAYLREAGEPLLAWMASFAADQLEKFIREVRIEAIKRFGPSYDLPRNELTELMRSVAKKQNKE